MKLMVEGLDRLGKDTLIGNIKHKLGYHQVLHFSKPEKLDIYHDDPFPYQHRSFVNMFMMFELEHADLIANRAHLGECVYSPLYRGYDGDYVFELEREFNLGDTRLVLLIEDFSVSKHFVDDGLSFDVTQREREQEMFIAAFEKSSIKDKRIVCVTDRALGGFRPKNDILQEVLE